MVSSKRLGFSPTAARLDGGHDVINGDFLVRSDRFDGFIPAASDVGDAGEQVAANLRAQVQRVLHEHLRDLAVCNRPAHRVAYS